MKKFLLFAFAAVMLGFAGCNDDENKDNTPPTLREYEAPVFMYGKTREEEKASVPYAYSGASETSLYFEGKGIVKEYIYIFEDDKVYSCGSILSDLYIDDLHTYLSQLYIYLEYRPGQRMYVYESEDKSLSIGVYALNGGRAAVGYLKD